MACPFLNGSRGIATTKEADTATGKSSLSEPLQQWLKTKQRVILLYEDYIHLSPLQQIWDHPVTEKPALEPCFAAAFHAVELCFLLLAEFISDDRKYVFRRPRIEMVAHDIQQQCLLLTEVVDGELEEDTVNVSRASLTQHFPFEACPPTINQASHSPCLQRLIAAIADNRDSMTIAERNSLIKVVLNITNTFDSSFSRWTVGLGIEHQLNELRVAAGLAEESRFRARARNLDYALLVHPEVVEATLSVEVYEHEEDFFFRTVHLGTECWAFVALNRIATAQQMAEDGHWHVAGARIIQASRMLHYLGDHILMLMSMNLRDYLHLKVEIQGTSGEGSKAVKSLRHHLEKLFQPLAEALIYHDAEESLPLDSALSPRSTSDLDRQLQSSSAATAASPGQQLASPRTSLRDAPHSKTAASSNSVSAQLSNGKSYIAGANGQHSSGQKQAQMSNAGPHIYQRVAQHGGLHAAAIPQASPFASHSDTDKPTHALTASHYATADEAQGGYAAPQQQQHVPRQPAQSSSTGSTQRSWPSRGGSSVKGSADADAVTAKANGDVDVATARPADNADAAAARTDSAADGATARAHVAADPATARAHGAADAAAIRANEAAMESLLEIYEDPDAHAGLYNYAKALEDVEAGLLAGFFHKHYCLASNVIGSQSKGTGYMRSTNKATAALKATYQTPVYPLLDAVRCELGSKIDKELAHLKGRIMDNIEAKRAQTGSA